MTDIEARLLEMPRHRVIWPMPLPMPDQARESRDRFLFKAQRLAHFTRGGAAAIGDDVRGHGRAERAILFDRRTE